MIEVPELVQQYSARTIAYVHRALGLELAFDSDTLPLLDHYLHTVPTDQPATMALVVATAGAYFGEVARRLLGGRWEIPADDVSAWRMVLPTGLSFSPAGFVASAIARADLEDLDTAIEAPPRMRPYVEQALARMGEVSEEEFYSLCGRLDTIEHLHEVLVAVAAQLMGGVQDDEAEIAAEAEAELADVVDDEPSARARTELDDAVPTIDDELEDELDDATSDDGAEGDEDEDTEDDARHLN